MKRGIYYVMLCLAVFTAVSCNKQLDIDPIDQIPDAKFWSTERDLDGAVAGGYALLRKTLVESPKNSNDDNGYHPRFYMYGDRRGLIWQSYTRDQIRDGTDAAIQKNRLRTEWGGTRQWDDILFNWAPFYQIIEQCNIVIENAHRVPDNQFFVGNTRAQYVAEARFLRAFTYFYMVRVWGNVPLVTKTRTTEKLGRTDMNAVLDFVEKELKEAMPELPNSYSASGKNAFRATKGTAQATLAHTLAWRHKDAEAVTYATQVITGGVYKMLGDSVPDPTKPMGYLQYPNIFKGRSTEGIFEIDFDAATGEFGRNTSMANLTLFGTQWAARQEPLWAISYTSANRTITRMTNLTMMFPEYQKDERYRVLFTRSNSSVKPNDSVFVKYASVVDPTRFLYDANIIVFRVADLVLLRAECNARLLNYAAAREDLNTIRKRVWLPPYTGADADLYLEIFKERSRELLGEGHYFYDLVRTGFLTDPDYTKVPTRPTINQADFTDGAWTWPVSNKAFVDNPNMEQMRYWQRY
ncbi:RagB/SusD family nutrient uptake outer membrane protein [Chitinophaga sp. 22620]|uniref:RagB/SusD family nutrient uptake outer membrane protein n=1 Tax=Chitinophaga sp. 22620 TaxID=3453952 RepID=UPI003F82D89B